MAEQRGGRRTPNSQAASAQVAPTDSMRAPKPTTADRVLGVLGLFTMEHPEWTVEGAARELNLSQSTAYEYFRSLIEAGLIVPVRTGRYGIGPAVIEFDRLARTFDPLISKAQPLMHRLAGLLPAPGVTLLCRLYHYTVMCVDERPSNAPGFAVSYERGRPMPLLRGSASKVILAHIPLRALRRYFDQNGAAIAAADLGGSWEDFRTALRKIRTGGVCITRGEIDPGRMGISAPVFGSEDEILGSISVVVLAEELERKPHVREELTQQVVKAGQDLTRALRQGGADVKT